MLSREERDVKTTVGSADTRATRSRDSLRGLAIAVVSVSMITMAGQGILFVPPGLLVLAPLSGLTTALVCRRPLSAALAVLVSVPLGTLLATIMSQRPTVGVGLWLPTSLLTAAVGATVGAAVCWALARRPSWRSAAAALAVLLIASALVYTAVTFATATDANGSSAVSEMSSPPALERGSGDHVLFLNAIARMRNGEGYYQAMAEALLESNRAGRPFNEATSVFRYRLPTLYVLLAMLPANGTRYVTGLALVGALASAAADVLARTAVLEPLALIGCAAVAAYLGFVASTFVALDTEPFAGAFGIVTVALFAASYVSRRRAVLMWAAAVAALLAALMRELGLPFVLLGLAATIADRESRERREWIPWTIALACTLAAYIGHYLSVKAVVSALEITPGPAESPFPWLNPDGLGLRTSVYRFAAVSGIREAAAWAIVAAGCVGAVVGTRNRGATVMAGGVTIGGAIVYLLVHPIGAQVDGLPPAYWGDVILPTMIACAPLCFALVPWMRRSPQTPG